MEKEQIIEMLKAKESQLWEALSNARLVFGEGNEATKIARARWSTVSTILRQIQNENN